MISKKSLKIILAIFFVLVLIGVGIKIYDGYKEGNKPQGDFLEINGLGFKTFGKPSNLAALNYVKEQLFVMANLNSNDELESASATDFKVRSNSFSQDFDDSTKIHTVQFIVDSKNLAQSFDVKYQWAGDGFSAKPEDLKGRVKCVNKEDVIFKDFKCIDVPGDVGWQQHAIFTHLPYTAQSFEISGYPIKENTLYITTQIPHYEDGYKAEQAILDSKNEALDWIRSIGFNPDDFWFEYK